MGAVYEVEHVKLGVRYGLKTYTLADGSAELFRKRFQAEGKLLARLRHPNLVRVFDLDYDEEFGVLYYVMDLVLYKDGEAYTLDDLEDGGADEDHLVQWFAELCDALAYVHAQGIVHRDVKLNNILLAPERHVVLSDFGISRVVDEQLRTAVNVTRTMVTGDAVTGRFIIGTAGYMAPEIERGEAYDKAADAVTLLRTNVKDVPAEVIVEIISKATVRANREKTPRLFELYQQAKTQLRSRAARLS